MRITADIENQPILEDLGIKLRERRQNWGISQRALARLVGTTQATISAIETGRSNPSLGLVLSIVTALKGRLDLSIKPPHHLTHRSKSLN